MLLKVAPFTQIGLQEGNYFVAQRDIEGERFLY
jgi:hypothetical protein